MPVDRRLHAVLNLTLRLSYLVPALLSPGLCAQLFGWHMGRFSLWEFFRVVITGTGAWYEPALLIAATLAIFGVLAVLWALAIRVAGDALSNLMGQPRAIR